MWEIPKIWDGGDVWIIGGGPSIVQQFEIPENVVQAVRSKQAQPNVFSSYMKVIHTKHIIGINAAYLLGDWLDIIFFGDKGFLLTHAKGLSDSKGIKVCSNPYCNKYKGIKYTPVDKTHKEGISPIKGKVSWNKNSGAAAISLAVHAGAKRIFLLGFDMKLDTANKTHWHNTYNKGSDKKTLNKVLNNYKRHLRGFPAIKQDADILGVEILNVNPDSAITEFEKITLQEALNK